VATFKELLPADIKTSRSYLSQLVDVLQEDISGSVSRRKYQQFVTGGLGPGITSSLFQTVYDQDFSLQSANSIFDIAVGLCPTGATVATSQTGVDAAGKETFPSSSLMMREKMDVYRQFAQALLGNNTSVFTAPLDSSNAGDQVDVALFVAFKRLFSRDQIKRETFAVRFYQTASLVYSAPGAGVSNTNVTSELGTAIYTDIGSAASKLSTFGGQVGNVVDSANVSNTVGLLFYDRGVLVLDMKKAISGSQDARGYIDAMTSAGNLFLGGTSTETAGRAAFIPDFVVSASIDNIIDHVAGCRFSSGSQTALTFQNITNINSTLVFCRASADEFNYSSNPTFVDSSNRIVVIDPGQEDVQQTMSYISSVGLYDANDNLLAVAKVSRPIQKTPEKDMTLRVRIDY